MGFSRARRVGSWDGVMCDLAVSSQLPSRPRDADVAHTSEAHSSAVTEQMEPENTSLESSRRALYDGHHSESRTRGSDCTGGAS